MYVLYQILPHVRLDQLSTIRNRSMGGKRRYSEYQYRYNIKRGHESIYEIYCSGTIFFLPSEFTWTQYGIQ